MSNEYKREPYRPTAEERAAERNKQKHLRQQAALAIAAFRPARVITRDPRSSISSRPSLRRRAFTSMQSEAAIMRDRLLDLAHTVGSAFAIAAFLSGLVLLLAGFK